MSFINQTKAHLWDANFWGPVTATLDWCEANYQFSRYIAESANTFSNLITVSLALWGAQQTRSAGLPSRYLVGYAGFALVGLGSMIFHATLLYEAQLADELPMIYVATYCSAVLLDTRPGFTKSFRTLSLVAAYFLFNIFFTWSYSVYRNPVYHQIVFATIMLSTAVRTRYLLNNFTVEKPTSHKITPSQKRTIGRIFLAGAGIFVFGFFIWNLDNIFCNTITNWKVSVGWPVAFLLEGHSWWHVFTATGTYLMIVGNTYLTLLLKDDTCKYTLKNSKILGLPTIARIDENEKVKQL